MTFAAFKTLFPVIDKLMKYGIGAVFATALLWYMLVVQDRKIDAAVDGHQITASLLNRHVATTEAMAGEVQRLQINTTDQNRAIIRLLELECLKSAETFADRRDCQAAREGN